MNAEIYKQSILCFLFLFVNAKFCLAQENYNSLHSRGDYWLYYNNAPHSLYQYIVNQALDLYKVRSEKVSSYTNLLEWQERQKYVKNKLSEIIGQFPNKAPLNPQIIKKIQKADFSIEHIIFESQPGFYVTSSLFIPAQFDGYKKLPVILFCSGHSNDGYRTETYQKIILNLVKKGFIVFAFDPIGQGERIQYYDDKTNNSIFGSATREHSYPGTQAFILGTSQSQYMIWDGIRAIDYLLTRPEVDSTRIGITGGSGGGTQTALIAALDNRIYASAPERYITSIPLLLQSIGPTDAEQTFYNSAVFGIDHADLMSVRAPKPTLIISTINDYFNIHGARESAEELKKIYRAYNLESNFEMTEDLAGHSSTKKNREALYSFFQKHLENPGDSADLIIDYLSKEELKVTSTGQVNKSSGGKKIYELNQITAQSRIHEIFNSRKNLNNHIPKTIQAAKTLSGYVDPKFVNESILTGQIQRQGYLIEKKFVNGGEGYVIPYLVFRPEEANNKALIYLHPEGKSAEASPGEEIEWFVKKGFTVLAPDLVGIGEVGPGHFRGSAVFDSINFNIWYGSIIIGRSIVGLRAGDIIQLTKILQKENNEVEIYGLSRSELSSELIHAAAFSKTFTGIALIEPLISYREIVSNKLYHPKFIFGAVARSLTEYDLPDLIACIAPQKLLMINVTDGMGEITKLENLADDIEFIEKAYNVKDAKKQLSIDFLDATDSYSSLYELWLD